MSLGWQEILLVMVFALVIFGPRRLPEIARQIGKAVREVRRVSSEFEREVKTSFAIDEHHSTYVVPETKRDAGQSDGEQPGSTRPEAGTPPAGSSDDVAGSDTPA